MSELISMREAAKRGIERIRRPIWADKMDHLKLTIVDGNLGPWIKLYAPFNQECNGRDPVEMLIVQADPDKAAYVPYEGPLPESEEYKAAQRGFSGVLADHGLNPDYPEHRPMHESEGC